MLYGCSRHHLRWNGRCTHAATERLRRTWKSASLSTLSPKSWKSPNGKMVQRTEHSTENRFEKMEHRVESNCSSLPDAGINRLLEKPPTSAQPSPESFSPVPHCPQ